MTVPELLRRNEYNIDPAIRARIEAREARNNVHHDVLPVMSRDTGTYGIVEPVNPGETAVAEAMSTLASTAFAEAFSRQREIDSLTAPADAALEAMSRLNEQVAATGQPIRGTFVHFYNGDNGNLKAVTTSIGGGHAYLYIKNDHDLVPVTSEQDPAQSLDGSEAALNNIKVDTIDLQSGDRLAVVNSELERNDVDGTISERQLQKAGKRRSLDRAASALVGRHTANRDKVAVVLEILDDGQDRVRARTATAAAPMAMSGAGVHEPHGSSVVGKHTEQRTGWRKYVPFVGGMAVGGLLRGRNRSRHSEGDPARIRSGGFRERLAKPRQRLGEIGTDYRHSNEAYWDQRKDTKGWRRAGVVAGAVPVSATNTYLMRRKSHRERLIDDPRYESMTVEERERYIRRRQNRSLGAKLVAVAAVAGAYPLIFDPGQDRGPSFFGLLRKNDDEGADLFGYPLNAGEPGDGNSVGYDVATDNRSTWGNDDPAIGHYDQSHDGRLIGDVIPAVVPFFGGDGDGLSPPSWWPDEWGGRDATKVWDPGTVGFGPDGKPMPEPEIPPVTVPDTEVPPVNPPNVDPEVPPVDAPETPIVINGFTVPRFEDWNPPADLLNVRNGGSLTEGFHELGHNLVGYNNFDGNDAWEAYKAVVSMENIGPDFVTFADGSDATYTMARDGEQGVRAPGQLIFANEEARRAVYDQIIVQARNN
jgi:hypothetical protein